MGYLGAGAEVEPDYEQVPPEGLEHITIPFPLPDDMIAFKVRGVSMLPVFKPDAIIIVHRDQKKPLESFYGEEAAVRTSDGRRFIKTITRGTSNGTVNLMSWNDPAPIENVRLEWIGEIFAVLPPAAIRKIERNGGIQGQLRLK
jgi:phage repressor protein C with HTH and peptisase S24 domain